MLVDDWENAAQFRDSRGNWVQMWIGFDHEIERWVLVDEPNGTVTADECTGEEIHHEPYVCEEFETKELAIEHCREHAAELHGMHARVAELSKKRSERDGGRVQ